MKRIVNVSNRLPVSVSYTDNGLTLKPSSGGLVSGLSGARGSLPFVWIGWIGMEINSSEMTTLEENLAKDNYIPVYFDKKLAQLFYTQYCNSTLWPALHYFITYIQYSTRSWYAYKECNERFADRILEEVQDNDVVWIHDYHLMLLPKLVREKTSASSNIRIGVFIHTNFPSAEVFSLVPNCKELCDSLLYADLIAFSSQRYADKFILCASQLLNTEISVNIPYKGRKVHVRSIPIGIMPIKFYKELDAQSTKSFIKQINKRIGKKRLVLSVDRVDYIKGGMHRLNSYERLLSRGINDVVFEIIAVPSREDLDTYLKYEKRVAKRVAKLNERFGNVINYRHCSVSFNELVAVYKRANVCVISSLSDGMNLVAFEYVASQKGGGGVLVLSRHAGCSDLFDTPMKFNTINPDDCANKIHQAMCMSENDRKELQARLLRVVEENTSEKWASDFFKEIDTCK